MLATSQDELAPPPKAAGLQRLMNRARAVFCRPTRSASIGGPDGPAPVADADAPHGKPAGPTPSATAAAAAAADNSNRRPQYLAVKRIPRADIARERVKKLAEKFGLEVDAKDVVIPLDGDVMRVEKPILMRVRRTCCQCKTFLVGRATECSNEKCRHTCCADCGRYPPRRDMSLSSSAGPAPADGLSPIHEVPRGNRPEWGFIGLHPDLQLLLKPRHPGPDLVYKRPRQRIRRYCCQCDLLFSPTVKQCAKCAHDRCGDCPRDPAKKNKYPFGYPGDKPGVKTPRFECEACHTLFPADAPVKVACVSCGHAKCGSCPRAVPRRHQPEPDPAVVKRLEERMAGLVVQTI